MAELIDKNELLKKAVTIPGPSGKSVFSVVFTDDIINTKAIEPRKGHLVLLDGCSNSGYYCSECQKKVVKEGWSDTVKKIKFCPNCGVKMESEIENGNK